jgi:hypothetical protein
MRCSVSFLESPGAAVVAIRFRPLVGVGEHRVEVESGAGSIRYQQPKPTAWAIERAGRSARRLCRRRLSYLAFEASDCA